MVRSLGRDNHNTRQFLPPDSFCRACITGKSREGGQSFAGHVMVALDSSKPRSVAQAAQVLRICPPVSF